MATYKVLAETLTTTKKQVVKQGDEIPDFWLPKENIAYLVKNKFIEEVKPEPPAPPDPKK